MKKTQTKNKMNQLKKQVQKALQQTKQASKIVTKTMKGGGMPGGTMPHYHGKL
jgi:hypothetical protein